MGLHGLHRICDQVVGTIEVDKHEATCVKLTSETRFIVQFEVWRTATDNHVLIAEIVALVKSPNMTGAESGAGISVDELTRDIRDGSSVMAWA